MRVEVLSASEWAKMSADAHLVCFNEKRDPSFDRIDFALITVDEQTPLAYMTLRELDSDTVYLQYGGSFPSARGTTLSFATYQMMLHRLAEVGYKRAGTYIENTNKPMLKFALKAGWTITGLRTYEGSILLEHQLKFGGE